MQFQIYGGGDDLNTRALLIKSSSQPLSAAKYCLHQLFSLRWQDFTFTAPPKTWYWEESLLAIAFLAFNFSTFRPMKCFVYIWCTAQFRVSAHLGGTTSYPPLASICPHHWYPKRFQLKNDSRSCPQRPWFCHYKSLKIDYIIVQFFYMYTNFCLNSIH